MILYSKGQNIMDHLAGHMTMSRFASPPLKLVCRLHACPHISLKSPSTLVSIFHAVLSMYSVWFSFGSSARSKKKKSRYNFANRTWQQILPGAAPSTTCRPDSVSDWKALQPKSDGARWTRNCHVAAAKPLTDLMKKTNQSLADFIIFASAPITDRATPTD